jgi:hypothetical protein
MALLVDAMKVRPDLQVVCSNRQTLRVLEVCGLRDYLHVSASLDEALAVDVGLSPQLDLSE